LQKICANFASKFEKLIQELHFLVVLFGKNLVSNKSTKASKAAPYLMPD
jgi:hypothetical protein